MTLTELDSMRQTTALLLLLAVVAGCTSDQRFATRLQYPDGSYPVDVVFVDHTGLVRSVDPGGMEGIIDHGPAPRLYPDRDKKGFGVFWLGGACTDRVEISFDRTATGFALRLGSHRLLATCDAIGLYRAVWVRFSEPVNYATVVTSGGEE